MKHTKKLFILIPLIYFALVFVSIMITYNSYNNLIDVKNTEIVMSEIQSSLIPPSPIDISEEITDIKIIRTEKTNRIYAVLFSYSDGETHYGIELFRESFLFKNRYEKYGSDNGTKDVGYYHFSEEGNGEKNELVVCYGNCSESGKTECVVTAEDDCFFREPVSGTFVNIYEFKCRADEHVFVYYN